MRFTSKVSLARRVPIQCGTVPSADGRDKSVDFRQPKLIFDGIPDGSVTVRRKNAVGVRVVCSVHSAPGLRENPALQIFPQDHQA
jgi:hypothetical protein